MSEWRHRVRRRPASWSNTGCWYDIVEFFPDGCIQGGWTKDSITPGEESIENLRESLEWMLNALDEPPIEDDNPYEEENE